MASTNIHFDHTTHHGRLLRRGLTELEQGFETLNDVLAVMGHMVDGDGSDAAHFVEVVTRFGFPSTVKAKEAWDELQSLMAKLNTDGSVSSVNAALLQAFAKMR